MIDKEEKDCLEFRTISDKDDTGKLYKKSIYYMTDSIRISFKTFIEVLSCSKSAQIVYITILNNLHENKYETKIDRTTLKRNTALSDSSISRAIEELKTKNLFSIVDKDTYHIPINKCVKGNVNTIIEEEEKLKEELIAMEKEEEVRDKITQFSLKLRNNHLIKNKK